MAQNTDTKPEPFFVRFKRLATHVDKRTDQLEAAVGERDRDCCVPMVIKTINDITHDLKDIKQKARGTVVTLKSDNELLDNLVSLGESLLTKQEVQINKTEDYLNQYGYVKWGEQHGASETAPKVAPPTQTSTETVNVPSTPPASGGKSCRGPDRPTVRKTPTMDGRGFSQQTMQYFNSTSKKNVPVWVVQPANRKSETPQHFQHRGIIVTPSLMGGRVDTSMMNPHEALASPVPPVSDTPVAFQPDGMENHKSRLQFDVRLYKSPATPVFVTPMFKSMCAGNGQGHEGNEKHVHNKKAVVGLFQNEPKKEPGPFKPEIKKEINRATFTKGFVNNEPQTPEYTYSFEEMSEMTGVYSFKPAMKLAKAPSPPLYPLSTAAGNQSTPEEPELLSDRLAKLPDKKDVLIRNKTLTYPDYPKLNKENITMEESTVLSKKGVKDELDNGSVKPMARYGDMPASPQLFGQYDITSNQPKTYNY